MHDNTYQDTFNELEKEVPGMTFVHNAGITVSFEDKESLKEGVLKITESSQFEDAVEKREEIEDKTTPEQSTDNEEEEQDKITNEENEINIDARNDFDDEDDGWDPVD